MRHRYCLLLFLLITLLGPGCDSSVDVLRPSNQYQYSLYGTLDVGADTQAIRVTPLGDSMQLGAPPALDVQVLLDNLDTNGHTVLRDSLVSLRAGPHQVHTFWTTDSIHPGTTYRIRVQKDGKAVTSATTTTPPHPPSLSYTTAFLFPPVSSGPIERRKRCNASIIKAENVQKIAAVQVIYPMKENVRPAPSQEPRINFVEVDYYKSVEKQSENQFRIPIFYLPDLEHLDPTPTEEPYYAQRRHFARDYVEVVVAAGGPDWPEWRAVPLHEIATPDSFSNVDGGHGFVGGVYSDTLNVPMELRAAPCS